MGRLRLTSTDPLALVLAAVVLGGSLLSLEVAGWVEDLPYLTLNGLAAITLAWALAALGTRPRWSHAVAAITASVASLLQVIPMLVDKGWPEKALDLATRLNAWGYAARTGGISTDPLAFYLLLLVSAWLGGYLLSWSTIRGWRPWPAIALSGVILLVNLNYGPPRLGVFFLVFILSSLLLVVRMNQRRAPEAGEVSGGGRLFVYSGVLALSLSLMAWFAPVPGESPDLLNVWYRVNTPWQEGLGQMNRLFAFLVSKERPGPGDFDKALVLRGTSNLSDAPVMQVETTAARYWRGLSYDYYTGQGWLVQEQTLFRSPSLVRDSQVLLGQYQLTKEVTQTFSILAPKNNLLFAAGQARKVTDVEANLAASRRNPVAVSLENLAVPDKLPGDLRPYGDALRGSLERVNTRWENSRLVPALNNLLPPAVWVTDVVKEGDGRVSQLQVLSRYPADVTALYASSPLQIGQKYTVISAVSEAPPEKLRQAGQEYPSWIADRYLQLPPSLPERVRALSAGLTEQANNPYDKALVIEAYLRGFTYSTQLPIPPGNIDRVDYMLFVLRKGYSAYFSTTMVVMLRAAGVPARVATGYTTGGLDSEHGTYLVKESNAHGWVEVFFPNYGWIEFEPTPSLPSIARPASPVEELSDDDLLLKNPDDLGDVPVETPEEEEFLAIGTVGGWPFWGIWSIMVLAIPLGLWQLWRKRWAGLDAAVVAYGKTTVLASLARMGPRSIQTPREYGASLQERLPRQRGGIERMFQAYERARYGGRATSEDEAADLVHIWRTLRLEMLGRIWPWSSR